MKSKREIGETIKAARLAKGLSRQRFGELIGYEGRCDSCVFSFESGNRFPPLDRMRAIHEVLGLAYEEMIP